ncbi:E3 ubiquitin-protein ligase RZF1 [Camellia lanceoleosa]|uniref:E3 ubiquitin-protein ligase RZF1 n=1 Tax=Camellia lanceoleosa TaxID=1840588 RepID=A0ACC0GYG7_9ERIC|nr:E3 ubiquitin-protein ligase RZF1 [Camellia lanceoleosa]
MSLSPPRETNNGNRNYPLYWCYQCHRTVRIASENPSDIACPRCFGQFLYEIDRARPVVAVDDFTQFDPSPEARILEALSLMFNPLIGQQNRPIEPRESPLPDIRFRAPWERRNDFHGRDHRLPDSGIRGRHWPWPWRRNRVFDDDWGSETGILARSRPWIILRPAGPLPIQQNSQEEGLIPRMVNPRDYFIGPGLSELIEQLTQNDRHGPPPAPDSAINSLPIVKITPDHLVNDSHCPVCKEEFKVGGDAKELPCKHIYHSDCIDPWLKLHNSCPVCRHELPVAVESRVEDNNEAEDSTDGGRVRDRWWWRLRQLASLWPFHSRYRPFNPHGGNITTHGGES